MNCPLCASGNVYEYAKVNWRTFFRCRDCTLVFVPPHYHCTPDEEQRRYALHDNTESNEGYVRYLGQTVSVICERLPVEARVLDFGCGEHAVLAALLRKKGLRCSFWDPLYERHARTLTDGEHFGMVVINEVIEHCRNIGETLETVRGLLSDEGEVVVRTQCYPDDPARFEKWWYVQDPTHVIFFSQQSLQTAAAMLDRSLETTDFNDIYILS